MKRTVCKILLIVSVASILSVVSASADDPPSTTNLTPDTSVVVNQGYDGVQKFTPTDEIPEFSTIAIPVVAILGLFLFFNYRKRRKK